MTQYINELLQEVLGNKEDYKCLSEIIYKYIIKNDESKYNYIIDAIQIAILSKTDKFIDYQLCENIYLSIKGMQSVFNE